MATKKAAKKAAPETETSTQFELDGETLEFDINDLTFGEVEFIESYFGVPLDMVPWESGRGSLVGAYLARKRKDDTTTLDELREMKINVLKQVDPSEKREADADPPSGA